jgi:hypothetical protein
MGRAAAGPGHRARSLWTYHTAPGRTAGTVKTKDVDFSDGPEAGNPTATGACRSSQPICNGENVRMPRIESVRARIGRFGRVRGIVAVTSARRGSR